MNWLNIYRPKLLENIKYNNNEISKAKNWIINYKKNSDNSKKVLLIIGPTGCGKTLLADLILSEYNYQKIELNSGDTRSQKKIGDFLKKALTYKNVIDMFNDGNKPIGILIDEIDTICKMSDKGGFSEFLNILKMNDKYEAIKQNNLDKKKKQKKIKILIEDYIKLYNPIICTSNDITDKKITELKKYSEVIYLKKPLCEDFIQIIDEIYKENNQSIDKNVKNSIYEYTKGDVRQLIILLEELFYFAKKNRITNSIFEEYKKIYNNKVEDIQLIEGTRILLSQKIDIYNAQAHFDIDCLLIPLMIHQNSIDCIKNSDDTLKRKLEIYNNVLESLCIHDTIQTNIFEMQEWDDLYDISSIYGAVLPNFYFNELKTKSKKKDVTVEFTSLLNKISQMYTNKKLLNSAKFSLGKVNFDSDEIIYITEIISDYFEEYKSLNGENDNNDENDNNEDEDENENEDSDIICSKKIIINNSKLVSFMNNYQINIDGLENILKIEKLNQINEKRKKKFTLKIKKEISNFLITI
jgi:DNA polymerase III delta prime subunit